MSTAYYTLRKPITHLAFKDREPESKYIDLQVFIYHQLAGSLCLYKGGEAEDMVFNFAQNDVDDLNCPIFTYAGPDHTLIAVINIPKEKLHTDTLISAKGEITLFDEVLARANVVRTRAKYEDTSTER